MGATAEAARRLRVARSQAARLPKTFRLEGSAVVLTRFKRRR